jgi:hypothetical protein
MISPSFSHISKSKAVATPLKASNDASDLSLTPSTGSKLQKLSKASSSQESSISQSTQASYQDLPTPTLIRLRYELE